MLYRVLVPVVLFASITTPAPQEVTNSDITYVKIKPLSDINQETTRLNRETKIENIRPTIPDSEEKTEPKKPDSVILPDITFKNNRSEISLKNNRTDSSKESDSNLPEPEIEDSGSELTETLATDDTQIDSFPADTFLSDRRTRIEYTTANYESGETTEIAEALTERYEEDESELRKYPSLRSFPKLSHKRKGNGFSFTANLIDKTEKRKFRSTCKCMKIWNCPKLQISVGRCAEEYFLCCF